ncbi:Syntaxin ufe1 [Taphrina deformans PYCC 5710]|uniref:Syntaxin ufe1 n=1 Tax=Taphrina deformans (strain PYCC 5710 / ATCC 11124 / CBS 356.35 / IMI 108563 / JCM 9778 / NBRC 8474) TaxID=1097556 RepID=R4X6P8_TAPDE|nr:Syntaxin ufe1 [Taphrina deformans PYCC 5710]|eukprot:CCG80862.1 Syntaxin ufe1 [Taphrina deformans PYCC 5710]
MDLTTDFRSIAATYGRDTSIPRKREDYRPDVYLAEASKLYQSMLQLQQYLEKTRKAYLSNSTTASKSHVRSLKHGTITQPEEIQHLTDTQRDEIDYEVKANIREAASRVKELEHLESKRRKAVEESTSFFNRLMPNLEERARNDLLASHRASVTWYLNHKLLAISQRHADIKTIRLTREEEKRLAVHANTSRSAPVYAYDATEDDAADTAAETDRAIRETLLSADQLQEFESENGQILQEFENQVTQIRSVQTKLMEIAELSTELQQHLASQTEMTDRLMTEAEQTTADVTTGNQQLTKAKRRNKTMRLYITTIFLVLAFTLLFLDYYAS